MRYLIGLGANVGDRLTCLRGGLAGLPGRVPLVSSLFETDPVGPVTQRPFLNAACLLQTPLRPEPLMQRLLAVERRFGRKRRIPKGPRTLDLDILWWEGGRFESSRVIVPHPEFLRRAFCLIPATEVAPDLLMPDGRRLCECPTVACGVRRIAGSAWSRPAT